MYRMPLLKRIFALVLVFILSIGSFAGIVRKGHSRGSKPLAVQRIFRGLHRICCPV